MAEFVPVGRYSINLDDVRHVYISNENEDRPVAVRRKGTDQAEYYTAAEAARLVEAVGLTDLLKEVEKLPPKPPTKPPVIH